MRTALFHTFACRRCRFTRLQAVSVCTLTETFQASARKTCGAAALCFNHFNRRVKSSGRTHTGATCTVQYTPTTTTTTHIPPWPAITLSLRQVCLSAVAFATCAITLKVATHCRLLCSRRTRLRTPHFYVFVGFMDLMYELCMFFRTTGGEESEVEPTCGF